MYYEADCELKKLYREASLTLRDIANLMKESPGVCGQRLNGFLPPFAPEQRKKIMVLISETKKKNEEMITTAQAAGLLPKRELPKDKAA
jgi:hypothetical protein